MSLLVLGTGGTIKRLSKNFNNSQNFLFKSFGSALKIGVKDFIDNLYAEITQGNLGCVDLVMGLTDSSSLIANLLNLKLGFLSTSFNSLLSCQNKFICRNISLKYLPNHTPKFYLLHTKSDVSRAYSFLKNPKNLVFYKPVKGSLSFYSSYASSSRQLSDIFLDSKNILKSKNKFYTQILKLAPDSKERDFSLSHINSLLVEEVIQGTQITVDGYVDFFGNIGFFGITKSNFLPNTLSFRRFDFPFNFSEKRDSEIYNVSKILVQKLHLKRTLFNIEFMVNKNSLKIVEINPRPSSQFMYLIHKTMGIHPLVFVLENILPQPKNYKGYANIFILRKKKDAFAQQVPSKKELLFIEKKYNCQINLFIKKGKYLSDYPQDLYTYRYAEIKIFGKGLKENKDIFKKIKKELIFKWA